MARGNLKNCLPVVLVHEGGWSDHPKDPGGATMRGVTLATFRRYMPGASKADLRAISTDMLERIYRDGYWNPVRGEELPAGVDLAVFDYGVNSGPSRSIKDLQRTVGMSADGKIGLETMKAINRTDGKRVIQGVCSRRMSFLGGLAIWNTFKNGWTRRVADVEAKAVVMLLKASGASPAVVAGSAKQEAEKANSTAKQQNTGAAGTAAGGGGVTVATDTDWLLIGGIVAAVVIVALILVMKARQNKARAEAYEAAVAVGI